VIDINVNPMLNLYRRLFFQFSRLIMSSSAAIQEFIAKMIHHDQVRMLKQLEKKLSDNLAEVTRMKEEAAEKLEESQEQVATGAQI
jgi:hypothetical protein